MHGGACRTRPPPASRAQARDRISTYDLEPVSGTGVGLRMLTLWSTIDRRRLGVYSDGKLGIDSLPGRLGPIPW